MKKYFLKRILAIIPIMFAVTIVTFLIVRAMPGDASTAYLMAKRVPVTKENLEMAMHTLGLDRPLYEQYFMWLSQILRLDLGVSYMTKMPVAVELAKGFAYTVKLAALALLWLFVFCVPMGILSAAKPGSVIDRITRVTGFLGSSIPSFWLGFILVQIFAIRLNWLPVSLAGGFKNLILPSATIAAGYIPMYTRILRNSILENKKSPYVVYAKARGIDGRKIFLTHILKNSLIPLVTSLGMNLGGLLCGSVIVENVFSFPGLGRLIVEAIGGRDYPVIQGYILLLALIFILTNLLSDMVCAGLNPRMKLEGWR